MVDDLTDSPIDNNGDVIRQRANAAAHERRVRGAYMRMVQAVSELDDLGIDVATIDMIVVRDFWRQISA